MHLVLIAISLVTGDLPQGQRQKHLEIPVVDHCVRGPDAIAVGVGHASSITYSLHYNLSRQECDLHQLWVGKY